MTTPSDTHVFPEAQPPKRKKPVYKRVWFWLAVGLLLVIVVVASSSGGSSSSTTSAYPTSNSSVPAANQFPGQQKNDQVVQAGQPVTIDHLTTTATPLVSGSSTIGATLCSTVTIVNKGTDTVSYNPFNYKMQTPAGAATTMTIGGSDDTLDSGDLAPGGRVNGDVCFKDPGTPGTFALLYTPVSLFSNDRGVWLTQR